MSRYKLEPELLAEGHNRHQRERHCALYPRLMCKVNVYSDRIVLSQNGRDFGFQNRGRLGEALQQLFFLMDGTKSLEELRQLFSPDNPEAIDDIVCNLYREGLLDDVAQLKLSSGTELLLELETLASSLLDEKIKQDRLWKISESNASEVATRVLYGFALENYHFFSQKRSFPSLLSSFSSSANIRELLDKLYYRQYGQDRLAKIALNMINITEREIADTIPLPATMALANSLAFWANFEPLFFLCILGVLTTRTIKSFECYLKTCKQLDLNTDFIEILQRLVDTKLRHEANLIHSIFKQITWSEGEMKQRFKGQTYLFSELYHNFHTAIEHYYSSAPHLLRRVSAI